jgi:hypothetical protein
MNDQEQYGKATCNGCGYTSTNTYTIEVWNEITGNCPQCQQTGGEFQLLTLNLDTLAELIRQRGLKAAIEHTGGGCATIYVGEPDTDGFYLVAAGAGHFDGANWTDPRAYWGDFCWGLDDEGMTQPTFENNVRPLENIADEMVALAREVEANRNGS